MRPSTNGKVRLPPIAFESLPSMDKEKRPHTQSMAKRQLPPLAPTRKASFVRPPPPVDASPVPDTDLSLAVAALGGFDSDEEG